MSISIATELHRRAAMLRALATRLDGAQVNDLPRRAGADTWLGPVADNCLADLVMLRDSLTGSADELRARARVLDQRAAAIPLDGTTPSSGPR
jgi:hypothetical protein